MSSTVQDLGEALGRLSPVALEDVLTRASLQTRVDRKYVIGRDTLMHVLDRLGDQLSVLETGGRRLFRYESVYFDTPDLAAYHQHAYGRRRRVKVRTRAYLDTGECLLEFKRVGGRGETVKERHQYPLAQRHELDEAARSLAHRSVGQGIPISTLEPVLTTAYLRFTLVDTTLGARVTCDADLQFGNRLGRRFGPLPDLVVVESKTAGAPSAVDRLLQSLGRRPLSLSKYCVGMAVLDPSLPANRWNRELRMHFGWTPQRAWGDLEDSRAASTAAAPVLIELRHASQLAPS